MKRKKREPLVIPKRKALRLILKAYGVTYTRWGRRATKTMTRLFGEIRVGESTLYVRQRKRTRLLRSIRQAQVRVYHEVQPGKWLFLYEEKQVFRNGFVRTRPERTVSMSEKLMTGETALMGALRGLTEELGVTLGDPSLLTHIGSWKFYKKDSEAYPGLSSESNVDCYLLILPPGHFKPEGYEERQKSKTTYFTWRRARKGPTTKKPAR